MDLFLKKTCCENTTNIVIELFHHTGSAGAPLVGKWTMSACNCKTLLQCLPAFSKTIPVWLWQVPPKHIEEDFDYIQQVSVSLVVFGQQLYFYQVGYHWSMLKTNMGNLKKCSLPSRSISNRCLSLSMESLWVWANYQTPSKPPAASGSL